MSALARSQFGGSGGPRRRPTRNAYGGRSASTSRYDGEEEEGYGSGDYDEGFELVRIKVKVSIFCLFGDCQPFDRFVTDPLQW